MMPLLLQAQITPYDGYIIAVVALGGAIIAIWKGTTNVFNLWKKFKAAIESFLSMGARLDKMETKIDGVSKELRPNGGGSMRDGMNRIERDVTYVKARQTAEFYLSDDVKWEADASGAVIAINKRFCELVGRAQEEILGANWKNTVHPDDIDALSLRWQRAVDDKRDSEFSYRVVRPDGTIIPVKARGVVKRDGHGQVLGWFGTVVVSPEEAPSLPRARIHSPGKKKVMIIEDNDDFRDLAELWLSSSFEVQACATGDIAIQEFRAAQSLGRPFDLVICDFSMPEKDGQMTCQALRDEERTWGKTPFVFLSGEREERITPDIMDRLRIRESLRKPISFAELIESVGRIVGDK